VVVDVSDLRTQPLDVEGSGSPQADLLHRREQELDPGVRPAVVEYARGGLEHRGDGGLVVGSEDRPACIPDDAVLAHHRLERSLQRNCVEVRAEEERDPAVARGLDPREDVPDLGADLRPSVVLVRLQS
jgi:hypothetical protein